MTENADPPSIEQQREVTLNRLEVAASSGEISLDEYGRRVGKALRSQDSTELAPLCDDLAAPVTDVRREPSRSRAWIIGIFGGGDRTGAWEPAPDTQVINVFGGCDLDLQSATLSSHTTRITVWSLFGGSDITVPPSVRVKSSGFALFGGNDTELSHLDPRPNAPVIEVHAYSLFGGTDVKVG